jgi:Uma2 family endonuclease
MLAYESGTPMGLEEFLALEPADFGLDKLDCELVDGMLVVNPSAAGPHQFAISALTIMLGSACPSHLAVLGELDWVLWREPLPTVRKADLIVVTRQQSRLVRLTEPPLLAIEVVSPQSSVERDLVNKKHEYATAGCPNYWVVFADRPELIRHRIEDDRYVEVARHRGNRKVRITDPFLATIDLARIVA